MAMLGHFWGSDWSDEERERWVAAAVEKAKLATWPVEGLAPGPVWTVRA
jgi:hypothetical protein